MPTSYIGASWFEVQLWQLPVNTDLGTEWGWPE